MIDLDFNYKKDIVYKTVNGHDLCIDFLVPNGSEIPVPCVVWFHGGGWKEGKKTDIGEFPFLPMELLSKDICIASAEYRLTGKNGGGFSQSVSDAKDAIEFVKSLPFVSCNGIFTGGISAGAYMALETAMMCETLDIKGVLSFSGITFVRGNDPEFVGIEVPSLTRGFIRDFIDASKEYPDERVNPSFLLFGARKDIRFFLVHGDCDECVNVRSADMFANRAKDLGFYIEYVRIHNSNHTFSPVNGALYPPLRDIMKKAAEFVKKFS